MFSRKACAFVVMVVLISVTLAVPASGEPLLSATKPPPVGVYVGNGGGNGNLVGFHLADSGDPTPFTNITSDGAATLALSPIGFLWVGAGSGTLDAYSAAQLPATGDPSPAVTISNTVGAGGSALAFDPSGDLWAGTLAGSPSPPIIEYTPSQLTTSGSPAPAQSISGTVVQNVNGMAFDSSGDMWVSDYNDHALVEFTATQLKDSSQITAPAVVISMSQSNEGPGRLAFDAAGDLWVGCTFNFNILEFGKSQLTTSGSPTPEVVLSNNNGSLDGPNGVAFDNSGDLWASNQLNSSAVEFTPSQLGASGDPVPVRTISGSSTGISSPYVIAVARAPVDETRPSVSGTAREGQSLIAATGRWASLDKTSFSYQWKRCSSSGTSCSGIAGALSRTYKLVSADVGHKITVTVQAKDLADDESGSATAPPVGPIVGLPPTVTRLSPNKGPAGGGTTVTITGTNFTGATAVHFGKALATKLQVVSTTEIKCVSPKGSGKVDVTVTTPGGTSAKTTADQFTY